MGTERLGGFKEFLHLEDIENRTNLLAIEMYTSPEKEAQLKVAQRIYTGNPSTYHILLD